MSFRKSARVPPTPWSAKKSRPFAGDGDRLLRNAQGKAVFEAEGDYMSGTQIPPNSWHARWDLQGVPVSLSPQAPERARGNRF